MKKEKMTKKNKKMTPYELYVESLDEESKEKLSSFFRDFDHHYLLSKTEKNKLKTDFEKAFISYRDLGISLDKALTYLDQKESTGFYARPAILWYPLDDAAKIYPLSMKRGQMAVFRLSVYLKQEVIPELLQIALTYTIGRFPSFATTVKKGFFWHYLDTAKRHYEVEKDTGQPCRAIQLEQTGSQSFRLMYYQKRISVEFFHGLTDGTGGLIFLKTIVHTYFMLQGITTENLNGSFKLDDAPYDGETKNEFERAKAFTKGAGFKANSVVQMSGKMSKRNPYQVLHFKMNTEKLLAVAKKYQVTLTTYLVAVIMLSTKFATDGAGFINVQVPVNMRKYYPSRTIRNFSMYCGIELPLETMSSVEGILPEISKQLKEKSAIEPMNEMMKQATKLVHSVRFVPLFIKQPILKIIYGFLGDKTFTNTLSNLGIVEIPEEFKPYVEGMDFVLGTSSVNKASCGFITCGGTSCLSITKMTSDPSFEEKLYQLLTSEGLEIIVEGSDSSEN